MVLLALHTGLQEKHEMLNGALLTAPTTQAPDLPLQLLFSPLGGCQTHQMQAADQRRVGLCPERKGRLHMPQCLGNGLWPTGKSCLRNKRKTHSIMKINALKSLPGHHSWWRLTQTDVFWGNLEAWLMRWGGLPAGSAQRQVHTFIPSVTAGDCSHI